MNNLYLDRYAYPAQLKTPVTDNLGLIITIPCCNEPGLISTLHALASCQPPTGGAEVIVVVNQPQNAPPPVVAQNELTLKSTTRWIKDNGPSHLPIHLIDQRALPARHAGVGLARKIAMDEAVRRFEERNNPHGIIACFDADATCAPNYLVAVEEHFHSNPDTPGCAIYYEHDLAGANKEAITLYELGLRYYVHGLRYCGFPFAFQTVGSSMAVQSWAYQKQGGMNRRKAGEDFYFLNRIMSLGNFTELNATCVYPSSRESDRVPFGTGRAMRDWKSGRKNLHKVYHPKAFKDLKQLMDLIRSDGHWSQETLTPCMRQFLDLQNFENEWDRLQKHSKSRTTFLRHFFNWFDGFRVLKFIHFARDNYYDSLELQQALEWLGIAGDNPEEALLAVRMLDRERG